VPRRAEGCAVVREAMEAEELPRSVDPDLMINMLTAPLIMRALLHQNVGASDAQRLFDSVVGATDSR
jgi:Tetracyclin repressor-like, C-terminal domain